MPILNYTTKIDSIKTISEIQQLLAKNGVKKMIIDNDSRGLPTALTFCIEWNGSLVAFNMPCNFEGVKKAMMKNKKIARHHCTDEQALRTGWRILKDWIAAQLAIVEAEVATLPEVFLPYVVTKSGSTMYHYLNSNSSLLLTDK